MTTSPPIQLMLWQPSRRGARHRCRRAWVHLLTVVFIGADVAVLAEGTSHVWRSDILLSHFVSDIFRLPDGQRHDRQSWIFGAASGELAAVGDE
jgi:hypothetical protein